MTSRRLALASILLLSSCTRVRRPAEEGEPADAAAVIDGAPPDAFVADGCPTDPCVENRFPSTGEDGPFAPDSDTVLAPGVYHYTTITIPAGVTVTTTANGRLDLRARGPVVIDGNIDVSGGRGGDGGVAPGACCTDQACFGGGGGGGATAEPTPIATGSTNCGLPGPGGAASAGTDGGEYVSTVLCPDQGGDNGGGAGGSVCMGGGGGGGFAGGGGGGGYTANFVGNGGAGASFGGANGGAGGQQQSTPGGGGQAPGAYRGQNGTAFDAGCASLPGSNGGGGSIGAVLAADLAVTTTFYVGSGGGGGGGQCNTCNYAGGTGTGGGGGGGGAVRIASGTSIRISGSVLANGGDGGSGAASAGAAGGGGGSGGVIYLSAPELSVDAAAVISAIGGAGGLAGDGASDCGRGGDGGLGRIRLSVQTAECSLEGTFDPPLTDECNESSLSFATFRPIGPNTSRAC